MRRRLSRWMVVIAALILSSGAEAAYWQLTQTGGNYVQGTPAFPGDHVVLSLELVMEPADIGQTLLLAEMGLVAEGGASSGALWAGSEPTFYLGRYSRAWRSPWPRTSTSRRSTRPRQGSRGRPGRRAAGSSVPFPLVSW